MLIPDVEARTFFSLYPRLLGYAAERLGDGDELPDEESARGEQLAGWGLSGRAL